VQLDLVRAADVEHHLGEELLGEGHQVVVVGVCPVQGRIGYEQALVSLKLKETVDAGVGRTKAVMIEGG